ncbi:MAG: hypothetical protein M5U31_01860 [Acidimicrobiia bacterium]|nr:hypothetical protein [Acidimicrobiia bacterium]
MDPVRLETGLEQAVAREFRRRENRGSVLSGEGQAPLVEGPTAPGERIGLGAERQIVNGHHQGISGGDRQTGSVDQVDRGAGQADLRPPEPVPRLVAPATPRRSKIDEPLRNLCGSARPERDDVDPGFGKGVEQGLDVPADPSGYRLSQLPGVQPDPHAISS